MVGFFTEQLTIGDIFILIAALGYAVYAWRVGVPKVLREQNKDLKERNAMLEEENKQIPELNARVVVLESRVHELEAKGTEQIYNLILAQGSMIEHGLGQLVEVVSGFSERATPVLEAAEKTAHDHNE